MSTGARIATLASAALLMMLAVRSRARRPNAESGTALAPEAHSASEQSRGTRGDERRDEAKEERAPLDVELDTQNADPTAASASNDQADTTEFVRGVAVDDQGEALADLQLNWRLPVFQSTERGFEYVRGRGARGEISTDSLGRFTIAVPRRELGPDQVRDLFLETKAKSRRDQMRGHATDLPADFDRPVHVVISRAHVVFGGTTVDPSGQPIPGIIISAGVPPHTDLRAAMRTEVQASASRIDGRFELTGWAEDASMTIHAGSADWVPVDLPEQRAPALDLYIVLQPSTTPTLSIRVVGVCECPLALRVTLVRRNALPSEYARLKWNEAEKSYSTRVAEAGTYALEVHDAWAGALLASVEGIEVGDHDEVADPRLQPLDLTGTVRCVHARTVDSRNALAPFARITTIDAKGAEGQLLSNGLGELCFRMPVDNADLRAIDAYGQEQLLVDGAIIVAFRRE